MINSPIKESDFSLKQEGHHHHSISSDHERANKASSSSISASQWLRLKDPRIVRVSRALGGKDRHSKVCTIRGLRDRRVRLSVPTAIQLYDLQDRLGLNQPSKVVDWLLNAAKHEIDELPPLPNISIPPGNNFTLGFPSSSMINSNEAISTSQHHNEQVFNISSQNSMWKSSKSKGASEEILVSGKANWSDKNTQEDNKQGSNKEVQRAHVNLGDSILPRANNHTSFLGLMNTMPLGNYQLWETHSGDHVAQLGNHGLNNQSDMMHSTNVVPFPSTLSLSTGNSHVLVCPPPGSTTQSYFPSSQATAAMDVDPRQLNNHYQMLSSSSQNLLTTTSLTFPSFSLAMMTPKLLHSPSSMEMQSHKDVQD